MTFHLRNVSLRLPNQDVSQEVHEITMSSQPIIIKSAGHRKIAIADIDPNPHRNLKSNPILPEKIDNLIESFSSTGFWDNIVVRESEEYENRYQLAYGHNRLAALKDPRVKVEFITIPVAKLTDWQMYEAMVTENELGGRVTPLVALENVNVGCDIIEAGLKKIGKNGTWENFLEVIGRVVPVGTTRHHNNHGFEQVRNAFFEGEGLGRRFLVDFLPCGNMRPATINEIVGARYGIQRAEMREAEAKEKERAAAAAEREAAKEKNKERRAALEEEAAVAQAKATKLREDATKQKNGVLSPDIIKMFPRMRTATDFGLSVRKVGVPKEHHKELAKQMVKDDVSGEVAVERAVRTWWRDKQDAINDPAPVKGPKIKQETPAALAKADFDLKLSGIRLNIDAARKVIGPHVDELSAAWVNGSAEEIIGLIESLQKLADLIRKNQPTSRGHLHVVKG